MNKRIPHLNVINEQKDSRTQLTKLSRASDPRQGKVGRTVNYLEKETKDRRVSRIQLDEVETGCTKQSSALHNNATSLTTPVSSGSLFCIHLTPE